MWRLNFRHWILTYQLRDKFVGEETKRYGATLIGLADHENTKFLYYHHQYEIPLGCQAMSKCPELGGRAGDSEFLFFLSFFFLVERISYWHVHEEQKLLVSFFEAVCEAIWRQGGGLQKSGARDGCSGLKRAHSVRRRSCVDQEADGFKKHKTTLTKYGGIFDVIRFP